jgi:primosomal protein N'
MHVSRAFMHYLGNVVSKEGKLLNLKKILTSVHMPTLKTPKDIQVFNDMAQYYKCFIKDFAFTTVPITKLLRETKAFEWTTKCQQAWEEIKQRYMDALILIPSHWDIEFYVHINTYNLAVGGYVGAKSCRKM